MMEPLAALDDLEIQEKVDSLVGKGTRVLDCEQSSSFQTEEVLLVNGFPVPLVGEQGSIIKAALLSGQVPPGDLLNEILMKAGILKNPVELEATCNVKTTTKTTEVMTLRDKNGQLLDERMKEVEEDNQYQSTSKEVWRKDLEGKLAESLGKLAFNSTSISSSVNGSVEGSPSHRHYINGSGGATSTAGGTTGNIRNGGPHPHNSGLMGFGTSSFFRASSPASSSMRSSLATPPPPPTEGGVGGIKTNGINGHQHSPQSSSSSSGISEGSSSSRSESSASSLSSSRFSVSFKTVHI